MPIVTTHVIYVLTSFMRYAFSQYLKKKQIFSLVDYVHVYFTLVLAVFPIMQNC